MKTKNINQTISTETTEEKSILASRMNEAMNYRDISCKELAKKVSVSASTISGYRNDYRDPNFYILIDIANELNISLDYLAGRTDQLRDFRQMD